MITIKSNRSVKHLCIAKKAKKKKKEICSKQTFFNPIFVMRINFYFRMSGTAFFSSSLIGHHTEFFQKSSSVKPLTNHERVYLHYSIKSKLGSVILLSFLGSLNCYYFRILIRFPSIYENNPLKPFRMKAHSLRITEEKITFFFIIKNIYEAKSRTVLL